MKYRCTHCGFSPFETGDGRCPQCLRRGGLVDAAAPTARPARHWGRITLLGGLVALMGVLPVYGAWDLGERAASRSWPTVAARVTSARGRRLRCEVDFSFTVGSSTFEGHTERFSCPAQGEQLAVSYDAEDPSRHRATSGIAIFVDLFGLGFGAFGLVTLGGVLLYLLFPHVASLRRFAARVGSKDARAASVDPGTPAPTARR